MSKQKAKKQVQKNIKITEFCDGRLIARCAETGETQGDYIERLIHEDYTRRWGIADHKQLVDVLEKTVE